MYICVNRSPIRYVHTIQDSFQCRHEKILGNHMSSNDRPGSAQVVHTHRTSCRSGCPRGLGEIIPVLTPELFTSVSVDCSTPRSYLSLLPRRSRQVFTQHQSMVKTYPICDAALFGIVAAQLPFVTEIAPKSPFLCVNRSPIRYIFVAVQKVSVKMTGI